jgi:uncharacterized protein (DUF2235 family)
VSAEDADVASLSTEAERSNPVPWWPRQERESVEPVKSAVMRSLADAAPNSRAAVAAVTRYWPKESPAALECQRLMQPPSTLYLS